MRRSSAGVADKASNAPDQGPANLPGLCERFRMVRPIQTLPQTARPVGRDSRSSDELGARSVVVSGNCFQLGLPVDTTGCGDGCLDIQLARTITTGEVRELCAAGSWVG